MNYFNSAPSKLFAAVASANIIFGMAGLATQSNDSLIAATPTHASMQR